MPDLNDLMKQAQQMQEKMQRAQQDLAGQEVTGESGAGLVAVTMSGRHDVRRVVIDPSLMTEDREMLEDLLAAAVNDAVRKVEQSSRSALSGLAGGMDLSNFKMPF
ncbi:MAG: DNA-binding YbaB/EbfC family protein [Paraglaciecola psychrophila]|jgi:DNA-binding YbaB/EbfC family protein